jgi:hypothetical protein
MHGRERGFVFADWQVNSEVALRRGTPGSRRILRGLGLIAAALAAVIIVAILFWPAGFKVVAESADHGGAPACLAPTICSDFALRKTELNVSRWLRTGSRGRHSSGTICGRGCLAVWGGECPNAQAISQETGP